MEFSKHPFRVVLPYFLKIFWPLLVALIGAFVAYYVVDIRHELKLIKSGEAMQVRLATNSLQRDIEGIIPDLEYIAGSRTLQAYIASEDQWGRSRAVGELERFAQDMRRYDQIRWLDQNGREQLRIEYRGGRAEAVAEGALQDKSGRYYFRASIKLAPGEIYVSPLDLNVEQGVIEEPHRPIIRFATPTSDSLGNVNGVLVFNYLAERLIDNFARIKSVEANHLALLNAEGFWLYNSQHQHEWSFMFGGEENFANRFAAEWSRMRESSQGQFESDEGLFSFNTIHVADYALRVGLPERYQQVHHDDEHHLVDKWFVVSHYPKEAIALLYNEHTGLYLLTFVLAFSVIATGGWYVALLNLDKDQIMNRLQLHARVMESATNGVVITDPELRIIDINEAFSTITGYSRREILGKEPSLLASGRHDKDFYKGMWDVIERKGQWQGEIWNRDKEGSIYPELLSIKAIHDRHGRLVNYIGIFTDFTAHKTAEIYLRELANTDPLTRLPNRNLLQDRCEQAIAHAIRDKNLVAILFLDLDGFKPINDAMGHAAGDEVLKVVAERLLACVRDADTVARYGGDEFVVVLDGLQQESQASRVAEEILSRIGDSITIDRQRCQVGVSIGISVFPGDGDDADKLLKNADTALYAVKHGGKNSMKFYSGL